MRHRYAWLDPELIEQIKAGLDMMRLFNKLLRSAAGDPERAMQWMRELQQRGVIDPSLDLDAFFAELEQADVMQRDGQGGFVLSPAGQKRMRGSAFEEIFSGLKRSSPGYHPVPHAGEGLERLTETREYRFGDELSNLDPIRSTQNVLKRTFGDLAFAEEDLEVYETEHLTSCATVIAIDVSHSMVLYGEDRITPAKTVALALADLITGKYPKDYLGVIVFGDRAERIALSDIASIEAGPYHTNTADALTMARTMLASRKQPNKQIFLVTDGKPSAITEAGHIYKNPFGLDMRIVNRTLDEADRCRRHKVVITTFMIATDPMLQDFVEKLTRVNRGRAYFASPFNLGEFILADYIRNRRKRVG